MANDTARSSGVPTWAWAAAAVVSVIGFLVWISMAAQPSQMVAVVEDDTTAATALEGEAVTLQNLADGAETYHGRQVSLAAVPVAAKMGEEAFWIDLPNQTPFLVKIGPTLAAGGVTVTAGERVEISGRVLPMSDSIISAWIAAGAINENQEAEAQFAMSFIEASNVRPAQQQQ